MKGTSCADSFVADGSCHLHAPVETESTWDPTSTPCCLCCWKEQQQREKLPIPAKLTSTVSAASVRAATDLAVFSWLVALGKWLQTDPQVRGAPLSVTQHRNFQLETQGEWKGCGSHNKPNNRICHRKAFRVQMYPHVSFVAKS